MSLWRIKCRPPPAAGRAPNNRGEPCFAILPNAIEINWNLRPLAAAILLFSCCKHSGSFRWVCSRERNCKRFAYSSLIKMRAATGNSYFPHSFRSVSALFLSRGPSHCSHHPVVPQTDEIWAWTTFLWQTPTTTAFLMEQNTIMCSALQLVTHFRTLLISNIPVALQHIFFL